jgi:hypothetical protein
VTELAPACVPVLSSGYVHYEPREPGSIRLAREIRGTPHAELELHWGGRVDRDYFDGVDGVAGKAGSSSLADEAPAFQALEGDESGRRRFESCRARHAKQSPRQRKRCRGLVRVTHCFSVSEPSREWPIPGSRNDGVFEIQRRRQRPLSSSGA